MGPNSYMRWKMSWPKEEDFYIIFNTYFELFLHVSYFLYMLFSLLLQKLLCKSCVCFVSSRSHLNRAFSVLFQVQLELSRPVVVVSVRPLCIHRIQTSTVTERACVKVSSTPLSFLPPPPVLSHYFRYPTFSLTTTVNLPNFPLFV